MPKFSTSLSDVTAKVKSNVDTVVRVATLALFRAVVLKSPVDTGQFRANWNVSYGAQNLTTSESTDDSRINAEISGLSTSPVGGIVYLSNGLPYARRLEYEGWSKQAPAGMIRVSVLEFPQLFEQAAQ